MTLWDLHHGSHEMIFSRNDPVKGKDKADKLCVSPNVVVVSYEKVTFKSFSFLKCRSSFMMAQIDTPSRN